MISRAGDNPLSGIRHDLVKIRTADDRQGEGITVIDGNVATVVAFNEAINARDLDALARLMHEQHRFIDAAGATVDGRRACVEAWRGFFDAFPDYHNVFDDVRGDATGAVEARGRSECSVPDLQGPARWRALVQDGLVVEWQVSDVAP